MPPPMPIMLPAVNAWLSRVCSVPGLSPLKSITRHILGLFNGLPGARAWRRHLSEAAHKPGAGPEVIEAALEVVLARLEARGQAA